MKKRIEQFLLSPWYPLLFSVYPALSMLSINLYQTHARTVLTPLIFSLLTAALCLWTFSRWYRDRHAAALATCATLFLFFSYGHILDSSPFIAAQLNILLPVLWSVLFLAAIFGFARLAGRVDLSKAAPAFNLMAVVLLLFPAARFLRIAALSSAPFEFQNDHFVDLSAAAPAVKPDIYYIIMDGYGRSDELSEKLGFDNTDFLRDLEEAGFVVADCSQTNYPQTGMSLTSSMNMDYIQELSPIFLEKQVNRFYYARALTDSSVQRSLETAGYTTVTFASGFPWSEPQVEHYLAPRQTTLLNEFDVLFMRTTSLRMIDQFITPFSAITDQRYRQRLVAALNSQAELAQIPGPKFVFMHVLSSHVPYGIDHNGQVLAAEFRNSATGYIEQTRYASGELLELVRQISAASTTPPVIIIQADHGIFLEQEDINSFLILNAYYFPGHADLVYSDITPVNTFRLLFNAYFGTAFPLLEDLSYLPDPTLVDPYRVITNPCLPAGGE